MSYLEINKIMDPNRSHIIFEDKSEHKVFQANAVFYKNVLENYGFDQSTHNKDEVAKNAYSDCIYRDDGTSTNSKASEQKFWSDEFDDEFSSFYDEDQFNPINRVDRKSECYLKFKWN